MAQASACGDFSAKMPRGLQDLSVAICCRLKLAPLAEACATKLMLFALLVAFRGASRAGHDLLRCGGGQRLEQRDEQRGALADDRESEWRRHFRRAIRFCSIAATSGTERRSRFRPRADRADRRSRLARTAAARIRSSRARRCSSTSGYTLAPNTLDHDFSPADSGTSSTDSATRTGASRSRTRRHQQSGATMITISVTASPTAALNITGPGSARPATRRTPARSRASPGAAGTTARPSPRERR